jgi:hypothetical protein
LAVALGLALIILAVLSLTGTLGSGTRAATDPGPTGGASQASGSGPASSGAASQSASSAPNSAAMAPLTVLNNSTITGLAGRAKDAFTAKGWTVSETGNVETTSATVSTVYYTEGNAQEQAAAKNLQSQFPQLTQVQPRPADIAFTGVVVVLTGDWDPANG